MIKLVAFDLDGVLVESKDTHFIALNDALEEEGAQYIISMEDHLKYFDGLPTGKKLNKLTEERGLPSSSHQRIWRRKQEATFAIIESVKPNNQIVDLFAALCNRGIKIWVASNSIRKTTRLYLLNLGLIRYIDRYLSADDVFNPKPSSEMYLRMMVRARVEPYETMIVEDSHIGITSAVNSGAHLCRVNNPNEVDSSRIIGKIESINTKNKQAVKWQGGNVNILIPMAGAGSRFKEAGYTFPKPLIEINGKPMIQVVVENINIEANYIYIVQKEHYDEYNLQYVLNMITPGCKVVCVNGITEGACCTTLLAEEYIDNAKPLLIANSDQYVEWSSSEFMYSVTAGNIDGSILTFKNTHPKWSYAKTNDDGRVTEVAEKKPISDNATVGIYYWRSGSSYVRCANRMIDKNIRTNNEFYVCPVYNEAIQDGMNISTYGIESMYGLGTPEDLKRFIESGISHGV